MLVGGAAQFVLTAYTNRNYVIEAADTLPNWVSFKTNFQAESVVGITDNGASAQRFYRARLAP